jgi:hypothetical protein
MLFDSEFLKRFRNFSIFSELLADLFEGVFHVILTKIVSLNAGQVRVHLITVFNLCKS